MGRKQHKLGNCDAFGRSVNLTYQGQDYFTTKCGLGITMLAALTYFTIVAFKLVEFFAYTNAFKSATTLSQSMTKQLDLNNIGFDFAFENLGEQFTQIKLH